MDRHRLKLRPHVRFAPTTDGAAVLGPSGALALRGATVYAWLERLRPLLDGTQDIERHLAQLPAGHRAVALRLVDTLQQNGFLREHAEPLPHSLTDSELRRYRHEIAYVGHWLDSPEHHFERYRTAHVLLIGSGSLHEAARHALITCGLRRVHTVEPGTQEDVLRAVVDGADAVVYAGDGMAGGTADDVAAAERACENTALFRALVRGGDCWLLSSSSALSWGDVLHRTQHAAAPADPVALSPTAATYMGGRLALCVFRTLTGVPDEDTPADGAVPEILRVDLASLTTHRHRVLPASRPRSAVPSQGAGRDDAADFGQRMKALREAPALTDGELAEYLLGCADDTTGPYAPPVPRYGDQVPLTLAHCAVAGAESAVGASLDPRAADVQALRRAAASYALVAARATSPQSGHLLFADRLTDHHVEALPVSVVLGAPTDGPSVSGPAAAGTACAESWETAVEIAFYGAVRELALRRSALDVTRPCPVLVPDQLICDPQVAGYWRLLRVLGPVPEVRDLSGGLGVPVIGLAVNGSLASVGCAGTAAGALAEAALGLLRDRQAGVARAQGRPMAPAGTAVTGDIPPTLAGADSRERIAGLAAGLADQGLTAYAVPLDQDIAFHVRVPFIARVVLNATR
ncbi:group-specific protein [Streptomyces chartreusis]|uniref:group-specific protein n=1 Tax=Streptomyces chartreusis TaxID=1969 RepID=UPI00363C7D7D